MVFGNITNNNNEVVVVGDAVGEVGERFGSGGVVFFEEFFGAGFVIGEGVESVLSSIFAFGGVVDSDVLMAGFFKSGLFGGGDTWSVGAV